MRRVGAGRGQALTDSALLTADGERLPLKRWLPENAPKAVIVALHMLLENSCDPRRQRVIFRRLP